MQTKIAARRVEGKSPVATRRRHDDGSAWIVGLMGTLALTYLGVIWVVVDFVG